MKQQIPNPKAWGSVEIQPAKSEIKLHDFQSKAVEELKKTYEKATNYEGLLVLPTGAGKTFTSAYFICKEYLDKGKKVL